MKLNILLIALISLTVVSLACGGAAVNTSGTNGENASADAPASGSNGSTEEAANGSNAEETPASHQEYEGIERIKFKAGSSSGSVKGSVKGYDRKDYVINAKKGQKMSVNLKSSSTFVYFNIADSKDGFAADMPMDPKPLDVRDWEGTLHKDGDYFIRVYLVRAEARRDGKADFTLDVSITGGSASSPEKGLALDKAHYFLCEEDNLGIFATFRESAGKKKVEVEVGDTVLRLDLQPSGSGEKYADAGDKNVFWLKGKEALLEYRDKTYTCGWREKAYSGN